MGQYRETAIEAGDMALLKQDVLGDLLSSWGHWRDMKNGASEGDRHVAEDAYKKVGLDPATAGDDYDRALKARYRYGLSTVGEFYHPISQADIELIGQSIRDHQYDPDDGFATKLKAWYEEQSGILLWNIANATFTDCRAALRALILLTNSVPASILAESPRTPIESNDWDSDGIKALATIVLGDDHVDQLTRL